MSLHTPDNYWDSTLFQQIDTVFFKRKMVTLFCHHYTKCKPLTLSRS